MAQSYTTATMAMNQRILRSMETWITEATTEAAKATKLNEPDDVDYFEMIKRYDQEHAESKAKDGSYDEEQEKDIYLTPHEPGIGAKERMQRLAYPKKTQYGAKVDESYRDFKDVKSWVRSYCDRQKQVETWKQWTKCHSFWELRHDIFETQKLVGEAKNIQQHMSLENRQIYDTLQGYQKTNFLIKLLVDNIVQKEDHARDQAMNRFLSIVQLEGQSADEYLKHLDRHRSMLAPFGSSLTEEQLKTKILSSLNTHYYQFGTLLSTTNPNMTLAKLRTALRELPLPPRRNFRPPRNQHSVQPNQRVDRSRSPGRWRNPRQTSGGQSDQRGDGKGRMSRGNPDDYIPQKTFRRVLDKVKSKYNLVLKNPSGGYPNSPHVTYVRNKQPNQRRPRQQRQPVSTAAVKTIKCYICGETTHLADSCPAKKQQAPKVVGAVGVDTAEEDPKEDDQPSDEEDDELDTFYSSVSDE